MKRKLFLILPLITTLIVSLTFLLNKDKFFTGYDGKYWENRYNESNWNVGWESNNPLGDAELYAYAGWKQIEGADPSKINTEMPPLGKYFLGLSILIFKNPNWVSLISGVLLLFITYKISKKIVKNKWLVFAPSLLLAADSLFRENLTISMLDMFFALFVALSFYFLILARNNPRYYFAVTLSLGAVSATKMYMAGFVLTVAFALYLLILLFLYRNKDIFWFILAAPLFVLIYFGSYILYFINNNNLWDFKYLHFWIRHFARVTVTDYPPLEILRIFLLGKWKTWWGGSGIISVPAWNVLWPLGGIFSLTNLYLFFKEKNLNVVILFIWISFFLVIYSLGVPYPRYILVILPAIYLSTTLFLEKCLNKYLNTKK